MLTITTWTVQNLFLDASASGPRTVEAYEAKLDALAATITTLAPDVIGLMRPPGAAASGTTMTSAARSL